MPHGAEGPPRIDPEVVAIKPYDAATSEILGKKRLRPETPAHPGQDSWRKIKRSLTVHTSVPNTRLIRSVSTLGDPT